MSEKPGRPSLPTSSTDFALPPSSSSSNPGSPVITADDTNPLLLRFRRPSIPAPKAAYFSETRLQSPLVASFTLPSRRKNGSADESESDRMWTDSSPSSSSENPTPPLGPPIEVDTSVDKERKVKVRRRPTPLTPPRTRNTSPSGSRVTRSHARRLSGPVKQPRILNLLHEESRPEESEVKSEAAFQRLIASGVDLPMQPRTPRAASDRGRYPEEAGHDETQKEDTPSDDDVHEECAFAFMPNNDVNKPQTPAGSMNGSVNCDEMNMFVAESQGITFMDVDMPLASPLLSNPPTSQWRYTPPPTTSAVRSNKRKFDDRFDPYPSSSKRRAVSPSVSYFRDINSFSHRTSGPGTPRLSIPISIPIPTGSTSTINSAASSPTIPHTYTTSNVPLQRNGSIGHMSVSSSPTIRSSMSLASPVIRPVPRARRESEEKEVEGAGEAVNGLTLG